MPKPSRKAVVDALVAVGGPLVAVLVRLFKEAHQPGPEDTLATYTAIEADFPGYAVSTAVLWGDTFYDADDSAVVVGDVKQFQADAILEPQTIHGYYLMKAGILVGAEVFDVPQFVTELNDAVIVVPRFSFGQ